MACMLTASMAGCANNGSTSSAGDAPAPEKTPELIWYIMSGGETNDHKQVMEDLNKKLKEKVNATLDLRVLGWGEFEDQMNMIINSNEAYDMCFTSDWKNSFTTNLSKNAFLDITDLYEKYGKDIAAQLPEWMLDAGKSNGKLYAIPNQQIVAGQTGVGMQKSLMDKYGIKQEDLSTLEGLEKVMAIIAEKEPDLIPISTLNNLLLAGDYGEQFANGMVYVEQVDGKFVFTGADVAQEADLRLRNEWYKKGYIREDIATNSDESPYFAANKFAILLNNYKPGLAAEYELSYGIEFVDSPVAIGDRDKPYVGASAGMSTMTAVSVNSKAADSAVKLINLLHADKEIFNELVSGIEGTHFKKTGDNRMEPIINYEEDNSTGYGYPDWMLGNVFNGYITPGKPDNVWEETDKMNRESEISPLRGFTFDPSPVQSELAQLSAATAEFTNMEYVTDDIDKLIADRTEKMKSAGLDRVVEEVQKQVEAWAEANGK